MNPRLLRLPDLKAVFKNLPWDSVEFLMQELRVPYTEDFHNGSEDLWEYMIRETRPDALKCGMFVTLLMFADTLLVKPEEV